MTKILTAALAAALLALTAAPSQGATVRAKYLHRYELVAGKYGKRAPGRNIVKHGTANGRPATRHEIARSARTLKRWLAPPLASVGAGDHVTAVAAAAGGQYAIPRAIVMCESGGNYEAVNPSSGARGAYQETPGTHAQLCSDLGWSPPDQDTCAGRIWRTQGRGAWDC